MKLRMLLFGILLSGTTAMAQRGIIKGRITDQKSKEPLTGATIVVTGTNNAAATDLSGAYQFYVNSGTLSLTVRYLGYKDTTLSVSLNSNELKVLNIAMSGRQRNAITVLDFIVKKQIFSIYKTTDSTGYILISDQAANHFQVFSREGSKQDPNHHVLITSIPTSTNNSDGSDIYSGALNDDFKHGIFVAMSDDKTFQFYRWEDLAGKKLKINK